MVITDIKKLKDILELEITNSSNVFVVAHNNPDFDAIGSSVGISCLANYYGKDAYIVVDDPITSLQSGIKKMIDEYKKDYNFIKKKGIAKYINQDSILIVTDVNKVNMISIGNKLKDFKSITIIDHHTENENTIAANNKFINLEVSSASEVVARILTGLKVKYDSLVANALLSGICLDTERFKKRTTSKTHDIAEKLIAKGADIDSVNSLFLEEFDSYCRISNLIVNGTVIEKYSESLLAPINVSFTLNRNEPKTIYRTEDYAKAADQMMTFYGIDASFALGYISENEIHISARGNKKVDVSKIMDAMGGGGNPECAGCKIENRNVLEVEEELKSKVSLGISSEEKIFSEPKIIKVKRIKK